MGLSLRGDPRVVDPFPVAPAWSPNHRPALPRSPRCHGDLTRVSELVGSLKAVSGPVWMGRGTQSCRVPVAVMGHSRRASLAPPELCLGGTGESRERVFSSLQALP